MHLQCFRILWVRLTLLGFSLVSVLSKWWFPVDILSGRFLWEQSTEGANSRDFSAGWPKEWVNRLLHSAVLCELTNMRRMKVLFLMEPRCQVVSSNEVHYCCSNSWGHERCSEKYSNFVVWPKEPEHTLGKKLLTDLHKKKIDKKISH